MTRREKNSESLEIRLGHTAKQAFMEACRENGLTASEVVRAYVEDYPDRRSMRAVPFSFPKVPEISPMHASLFALLIAGALTTSLTISPEATADRERTPQEQFTDIDSNGDGYVSLEDVRLLAGLTVDGELGEGMRVDLTETVRSALTEYGPIVLQGVTSDVFVERTIADAAESARESVDGVFNEMDTDGDQRISRQEFYAYSD
jgi:Ca2+-binding EF-hand superfamily protein